MVYVGRYSKMYLRRILGQGMDSRDGLPRGVLPSGILKMKKILSGPRCSQLPQEGEQLWNKSLNILLPEGLSEIQHLAGLHLVAEAYHENMQSIKSINRLINGLGENILEVDFIVNDMVEILESSVNAGIRFSDKEWQTIINAENSMVSLVEAAIN